MVEIYAGGRKHVVIAETTGKENRRVSLWLSLGSIWWSSHHSTTPYNKDQASAHRIQTTCKPERKFNISCFGIMNWTGQMQRLSLRDRITLTPDSMYASSKIQTWFLVLWSLYCMVVVVGAGNSKKENNFFNLLRAATEPHFTREDLIPIASEALYLFTNFL